MFLSIGLMASSAGTSEHDTALRVFGLSPGTLPKAKALLATEQGRSLHPALGKLISDADKALKLEPPSVMDKPKMPPSGDKHDYFSTAPYFWPDPTKKDGLPYIRKDGEKNPESDNENSDSPRMNQMANSAETLALAYYFTGREPYASGAARLLRVWFLEPRKRMNPNFNHAQAVPGVNTGRGTGMIESRSLTEVVDAVGLLAGSRAWTRTDQEGMVAWMSDFLEWARTSKHGKEERAAKNNHGTFYDVQIAHWALFVGQTNLARKPSSRPKPIASPLRLNRTAVNRMNWGAPIRLAIHVSTCRPCSRLPPWASTWALICGTSRRPRAPAFARHWTFSCRM